MHLIHTHILHETLRIKFEKVEAAHTKLVQQVSRVMKSGYVNISFGSFYNNCCLCCDIKCPFHTATSKWPRVIFSSRLCDNKAERRRMVSRTS